MTKQSENNQALTIEDKGRRKAVKTIVSGVTAIAAYNLLPAKWNVPYVESVFLPAHAATSGITDDSSDDTVTISTFTAHYTGTYWNVDNLTVDSTLSGTYRIEFFNDSALTTSVYTAFEVTIPYSVSAAAANLSDEGEGLWCRATNTSDPSITGIAQAVVVL